MLSSEQSIYVHAFIVLGCLSLLDTLPETVYRVCDLFLVVTQRNGIKWQKDVLSTIVQQVRRCSLLKWKESKYFQIIHGNVKHLYIHAYPNFGVLCSDQSKNLWIQLKINVTELLKKHQTTATWEIRPYVFTEFYWTIVQWKSVILQWNPYLQQVNNWWLSNALKIHKGKKFVGGVMISMLGRWFKAKKLVFAASLLNKQELSMNKDWLAQSQNNVS